LVQGLIRRIRAGETTHAWNQNWLPRDFILWPLAYRKNDPPIQVSDFIIQATCSWDRENLEEWFLPIDVEQICKIPLRIRRFDDCWAWHYERSGVLYVCSVYRILVSTRQQRTDCLEGRSACSNSIGQEKLWKKMWNTKVPSKHRAFL
jgi:hypothetical protein